MEGDLVLEADHDDQPGYGEDRVHAELLQRGPRHLATDSEDRKKSLSFAKPKTLIRKTLLMADKDACYRDNTNLILQSFHGF